MRTGKISEAILSRSVLKEIKYKNDCVLQGPGSGQDASELLLSGAGVLVASNPVALNCELDAYLGISRAANDVAARGGIPRAITAVVLLPTGYTELRLKKLQRRIEECCSSHGIALAGGHTEVSPLVKAPCVTFTCIGESAGHRPHIAAGQDIIMTAPAGLEGAFIMAECKQEAILARYSRSFYEKCRIAPSNLFAIETAHKALELGASYVHNLSAGGVFNGLWELAAYGSLGIDVDLKKIPVRQEIIELCELFECNPYQLASGGALLLTADIGLLLAERMQQAGFAAVKIGETTDSNDRIIRNDDEVRYLEEPKADEILGLFYKDGGL